MIPVNMSKAVKETSALGECVRFKKDVFGRVAVGAIPVGARYVKGRHRDLPLQNCHSGGSVRPTVGLPVPDVWVSGIGCFPFPNSASRPAYRQAGALRPLKAPTSGAKITDSQ